MIIYVSAFLSPHVKPFCDFLYEKTNGEFRYVETIELTEERKAMGYSYDKDSVPYVMNYSADAQSINNMLDTAECVIINPCSSAPDLVKNRLKNNLLTFFISERIFKKGIVKFLDPRVWKMAALFFGNKKKNIHLLAMGGYVGKDFSLLGFPKDKIYRFGYFPESSGEGGAVTEPTSAIELSWVGRMISWKRPEFAVEIIKNLKNKGYNCHLSMCGDGPLMENVKNLIAQYGLEDEITLHGMTANAKTREITAHSTAFVSTSTRMEGWGAVVNEALDAGTPVVACCDIGAAPYLIENGVNGYTYSVNDVEGAVEGILKIFNNQSEFRKNALETVKTWNSQVASERFYSVLNEIYNGNNNPDLYKTGPMSKE